MEAENFFSAQETLVGIKAQLLSYGVLPTKQFIDAYGSPFLEKRRAYGNPDDLDFQGKIVPQELVLLPERLICAVNIRVTSPWQLDYRNDKFVVAARSGGKEYPITFPLHPDFYDVNMSNSQPVKNIITLYGGGSLGVFVYGACSLVEMGAPCQYCSILPNRTQQNEFPHVITKKVFREALLIALQDITCPIKQVMINGGNFSDPDRSFLYYVKMVEVAREALDMAGRNDIDLHLIVYPPNDLALFERLRGLDVSIAMNMEVFDPDSFRQFCPGKHKTSGQRHIINALFQASERIGFGHVYSILVGGLEKQVTMDVGMDYLAKNGVIPVINVFHADPGTPLYRYPTPSTERIMEMGKSLQLIYERIGPVQPFYLNCGRNSLDTEAYLRLF
jgi:hypothetical protein